MAFRRAGLFASALALAASLVACSDRVAVPELAASAAATAPASAASGVVAGTPPEYRVAITRRVRDDLPLLTFTLVAEAAPEPGGSLRVRRIEIHRDASAQPVQRIDDLSTETPWTGPETSFELLDMNFDGFADFRLVEAQPAGPNLPYLNWLYDPASGQFVASPALNDISSPRFDAARRELRSDWRDGAAHYGTDFYAYRDGQLTPVRRESRRYTAPGRYTITSSVWSEAGWRPIDERSGRDP